VSRVKAALSLPALFAALLALGLSTTALPRPGAQGMQARSLPGPFPPAEPGTFPDEWIHGADCAGDPPIQWHAYNEDLYILRQSKCDTFEAPFLYLIFGEDRALLIDSGAAPSSPVKETVDRIIDLWLAQKGKTSIELIAGHSHSHGDHTAGDPQFAGQPGVTLVGWDVPVVQAFYGIPSWPDGVGSLDLGGRVLDVIPTPGHNQDGVAFYDARTHLLLTGDTVYPGHLFVFSPPQWSDFQASVARLDDWAATHPVSFVLGCHVEMSDVPGVAYAYGTSVQPDEHPLRFPPSILSEVRAAAEAMGVTPECKVFDEFVIHPVWLCGLGYH